MPNDGLQITKEALLGLSIPEKLRRFNAMVEATFSDVTGRDLLADLHPRHNLDIKRRVDGQDKWFHGDWLTNLMKARDGRPT